ncbi:MAG: class II fructose-bisphosphate aldolase [Candidatus Caldatribacteriaceae bacterium]
MPLVKTKNVLAIAEEKNFALPAFNIPIPEFILWVLEEAEELRAPVIIQVAPVEYKALDIRMFYGTLQSLSERFSVPFSLHLDHAHTEGEVLLAIQNGFSSVMIDGSRLPFAENVRLTQRIVALAHPIGVLVEGELGRVGGLEGDETWEKESEEEDFFTSPEEAEAFVKEAPVDLLAVAVGTRHGLYGDRIPKLQLELIQKIRERTRLPLVLHGGSGTPVGELQTAGKRGVRKINYSTALRVEYLKAFREILSNQPEELMVSKMLPAIAQAVKKAVRECIISSDAQNKV